jgi:hypothetical protein
VKLKAQQIQAMAISSYDTTFSSERAEELANELERHSLHILQASPALELDDPVWAHAKRMHRDCQRSAAPRVTEDE